MISLCPQGAQVLVGEKPRKVKNSIALSAVTEVSVGCCGQTGGRTDRAEGAWDGFEGKGAMELDLDGCLGARSREEEGALTRGSVQRREQVSPCGEDEHSVYRSGLEGEGP